MVIFKTERSYSPTTMTTEIATVIGGTVGGVVALTVVVGALILWKRRTVRYCSIQFTFLFFSFNIFIHDIELCLC